jgi:hypothetical protein
MKRCVICVCRFSRINPDQKSVAAILEVGALCDHPFDRKRNVYLLFEDKALLRVSDDSRLNQEIPGNEQEGGESQWQELT